MRGDAAPALTAEIDPIVIDVTTWIVEASCNRKHGKHRIRFF
jgi:hypothetical protein